VIVAPEVKAGFPKNLNLELLSPKKRKPPPKEGLPLKAIVLSDQKYDPSEILIPFPPQFPAKVSTVVELPGLTYSRASSSSSIHGPFEAPTHKSPRM
jgi:hypothetical protein